MKFVKKLLEKIKSWLRSIFNKSTKCETPRNDTPSANEPEEIVPTMNEDSNPQANEETPESDVTKEESDTTTEFVDEDGFLHIGDNEADFVKHHSRKLFLYKDRIKATTTPNPDATYRIFSIANNELLNNGAYMMDSKGMLHSKKHDGNDKDWANGIINSKVDYANNMSWSELVTFMRVNKIRYEYLIFDENGILYDIVPKLIFNYD